MFTIRSRRVRVLAASALLLVASCSAESPGGNTTDATDASPEAGALHTDADTGATEAGPFDAETSGYDALGEPADSGPDVADAPCAPVDAEAGTPDSGIPSSPVALIYNGPGGCDGCHQAVAAALAKDPAHDWQVEYVGPSEITVAKLAGATLYVQPGGLGKLSGLVAAIGDARGQMIVDYVEGGGHYLGFCMGGYYASTYGIGLLPGGTPTWTQGESATFVPVNWRGTVRQIYWEGGFYVPESVVQQAGASILARYLDGDQIAAITAKVGKGALGICGPHPEGSDWGSDPDEDDTDLVLDLLHSTLAL